MWPSAERLVQEAGGDEAVELAPARRAVVGGGFGRVALVVLPPNPGVLAAEGPVGLLHEAVRLAGGHGRVAPAEHVGGFQALRLTHSGYLHRR